MSLLRPTPVLGRTHSLLTLGATGRTVTDRVRGVRQFRRRLGRAIRNRQAEIEAARARRTASINAVDVCTVEEVIV